MPEFIVEYLGFLLKLLTFGVAVLVIVSLAVAIKRSRAGQEQLEVHSLNERLQEQQDELQEQWLQGKQLKQVRKERKQQDKKRQQEKAALPRVFVLDFKGDLMASRAGALGREISCLLGLLRPDDEVVVRLESAGGLVHSYGYAAAQLQRLRDRQVRLTICVDKVAASGGYMMACAASQILAAPFAVIGSIGVVAEMPNFNRFLKKHDVDYEVLTAGEYKRTLTLMGENTEEGRKKFLDDLESTHKLFKDFVQRNRPDLEIDKVAKGEIWYGEQALGLKLIDQLMTSDEYLLQKVNEAEVLALKLKKPSPLVERVTAQAAGVVEQRLASLWPSLQAPFKR
ncbi:inner membrane peptidase. Serine peptidase. MEROPS family S49 [Marinospirillum celere]|uniref:Inner membrane peptidase. Serine peptidase. MEROPS family S49 n=1 Tax=Marinospirillum celere TaxID=1122252 RepID=A0A1I1ED25_9GAMM|nr:protease SohB [Marinospirillum celere]SFB84957.1 inner membrane peptidase. Serine peptidase. MEROPS family S49 [Marinospirillum celere]